MKTWLAFLLKLAVTGGCLVWAFSGIDLQATVLGRREDWQLWWLIAGLGTAGIAAMLMAFRWGVFLLVQDIRVPFRRLFTLTLIGGFFSLASFGSLGGDAARIVLLSRDVPGRRIAITTAVLMDHLSGLVAMALLFLCLTLGRFREVTNPGSLASGAMHLASEPKWQWPIESF